MNKILQTSILIGRRYEMDNVSVIFTTEPERWGLRGDPLLWQLLKMRYQTTKLPYPPEKLPEDIAKIVEGLIGEEPRSGQIYKVEQFSRVHVGMSTGMIAWDYWLEKAIPLLRERLERANLSIDDNPTSRRRNYLRTSQTRTAHDRDASDSRVTQKWTTHRSGSIELISITTSDTLSTLVWHEYGNADPHATTVNSEECAKGR